MGDRTAFNPALFDGVVLIDGGPLMGTRRMIVTPDLYAAFRDAFQPAPRADDAISDDDVRRCEGCNGVAVTTDPEDVPLCRPCARACDEPTSATGAEGAEAMGGSVPAAQYRAVVRAFDALARGDLRALGTVHDDIQGSVDAIVARLRTSANDARGADATAIRWVVCPNGDHYDERATTFDDEREAHRYAGDKNVEPVEGEDWGVLPLYAAPLAARREDASEGNGSRPAPLSLEQRRDLWRAFPPDLQAQVRRLHPDAAAELDADPRPLPEATEHRNHAPGAASGHGTPP